jgi:hypothetical protein
MAVDVVTETTIGRPRAEVAEFAADPANATAWYKNIKAVEWETEPPLQVGSRLRFVARFLGGRSPTPTRCVKSTPSAGS